MAISMSERDAIVAWLRGEADRMEGDMRANPEGEMAVMHGQRMLYYRQAATSIERGDHLPASVADRHGDSHIATHAGEVERLREEIADLKSSVIAFGAPWAGTYAREFGLPPNHIHATHYDILEKAGARMVSFIRHDPEALEASR